MTRSFERAYRVVAATHAGRGEAFTVEMAYGGSVPAKVKGFATMAAADLWIVDQKRRDRAAGLKIHETWDEPTG